MIRHGRRNKRPPLTDCLPRDAFTEEMPMTPFSPDQWIVLLLIFVLGLLRRHDAALGRQVEAALPRGSRAAPGSRSDGKWRAQLRHDASPARQAASADRWRDRRAARQARDCADPRRRPQARPGSTRWLSRYKDIEALDARRAAELEGGWAPSPASSSASSGASRPSCCARASMRIIAGCSRRRRNDQLERRLRRRQPRDRDAVGRGADIIEADRSRRRRSRPGRRHARRRCRA